MRFILPADGSEEQVLSKYMVVLTLPDGAEAAVFQGSANENALVQLMTAMMGASAGQVIT